MSLKLQAHEWAPVCSFCFDVTSSVRVGHSVPQQVFQKKFVPAQEDEAMLLGTDARLANFCATVLKKYCKTRPI